MTGSTLTAVGGACLLLVRASQCGPQPISCWSEGRSIPVAECEQHAGACTGSVTTEQLCPDPVDRGKYSTCRPEQLCRLTEQISGGTIYHTCTCLLSRQSTDVIHCLNVSGCCAPCVTCYGPPIPSPPWCVVHPCE